MRGTLFATTPADLRLLLSLTAGRQVAGSTSRHRQLGLTDDDRDFPSEFMAGVDEATRLLT